MTTDRAPGHSTTGRGKRGRSATDRIVSTSLAVAACASLVGLLGLRAAQDAQNAQAAGTDAGPTAVPEPLSTSGLSAQQLDAYAAALEVQRLQLVAYREQLQHVADQLQARTNVGIPDNAQEVSAPANTPAAKKQRVHVSAQTPRESDADTVASQPAVPAAQQDNAAPVPPVVIPAQPQVATTAQQPPAAQPPAAQQPATSAPQGTTRGSRAG